MDIILTKRYDWLWPNGCYPTIKLWISSWQRDMIIGCGLMAVIQLKTMDIVLTMRFDWLRPLKVFSRQKLWISSWQRDLIGCCLVTVFPPKTCFFPRRLLLFYKTPLTPLSTSRLFRYRAPATCSHQGYYAVSLKMVTLGWKLKSNSIFSLKL